MNGHLVWMNEWTSGQSSVSPTHPHGPEVNAVVERSLGLPEETKQRTANRPPRPLPHILRPRPTVHSVACRNLFPAPTEPCLVLSLASPLY